MSLETAGNSLPPSVIGASGSPVWDLALKLLSTTTPGKLLDAAGGGGYLAAQLQSCGFQVTGLDLVNQWRFPGIPFIRSDLDEPLPFIPDSFDVITWVEGFGYVDNPSAVLR